MKRNEKKAKDRWEYVSERLCNSDYPIYNEEHELERAFDAGVKWCEEHPNWISVEDALPPRNTFFNFCHIKKEHIEKFNLKDKELDTSISCLVACNGDLLGFSYYNYKERKWLDGSGEGITHWMPMPAPPRVITEQKNKNNEK